MGTARSVGRTLMKSIVDSFGAFAVLEKRFHYALFGRPLRNSLSK